MVQTEFGTFRGLNIVRRKLADGTIREHVYAWRGGPAMKSRPGSVGFTAEYAELCRNHGRALKRAKPRPVRRDVSAEGAQARRMLGNARISAKQRGMPCDITLAQIQAKLVSQGFRCAVTGLKFNLVWSRGSGYRNNAYAPSLDRINCGLGYTDRNTRIVLLAINGAINEWGLETYLTLARASVKHASSQS